MSHYLLGASLVNWKGAAAADVPANLMPGLRRYLDEGIVPGDFLRSVLSNDLLGAVSHADPESLGALRPLVQFIWNEFPSGCWGTPKRVSEWAAGVRTERKGAA